MNNIRKYAAAALNRLKITRRYQGYRCILSAMELLAEDECRLTAVTKELYMEIGSQERQSWKAVERNIRTVVQLAWSNDPGFLQEIAGYELTEAPCASDFISILFEYAEGERDASLSVKR